jgi:pyruvate/2-oxoglutarate dehydrogenase complex dihydrolipoamide acyltransferase (E2) component
MSFSCAYVFSNAIPYRGASAARLLALLTGTALAASLAGCAVQPNGRGGMLVGVDSAELFGETVGTFALPNGQQGVLRRDSRQNGFSVKLGGTFRVVSLPNLLTARIAYAAQVGERTVAVIETQERNCPYKYVVLAIQGTDVLQWAVGNCRDRAQIALAGDGQALYLDLPAGRQWQRYVYADQRLVRTEVAPPPAAAPLPRMPGADAPRPAVAGTPAAGAPVAGIPAAPAVRDGTGRTAARVIPPPPHRADDPAASAPAPAPASAPTPAAAGARSEKRTARTPAAGQLPQNMVIPADDIKPVHIDLRNN